MEKRLLILLLIPLASAQDLSLWPDWAFIGPTNTIHAYPGDDVHDMMKSLQPGDKLVIHGGTYSESSWYQLSIRGTAQAPIFIEAAPGEEVIITRPDASQNNINIHNSEYVSFRNIRFRGGDTNIRIETANNILIEGCEVYECNGAGITANSGRTHHLYFMRNHIHHTGGHGEGFYLGANNGAQIMSDSVVYNNLVHDTTVHNINSNNQGDGIEVKQGSYGNLIKDNTIFDVPYPGIIVYGTDGQAQNIVEGNIIVRSGDNGIQAQGEAIVRNNIAVDSDNHCLESKDHQGTATNLQVLSNTFVTSASSCVRFSNFGNRENMVLANNVIYNSGTAVEINSGQAGGTIQGNMVRGSVPGISGFETGTGDQDFLSTADMNYYPSDETFAGQGQASGYNVGQDLLGEPRGTTIYAGAFEKLNSIGFPIAKDFRHPARDAGSCAADICVPGDYATITEAIANARAGDTIAVAEGAYNEDIRIDSNNLALTGSNAIVGSFDINGDSIRIEGFRINDADYCIDVDGDNSEIINNRLYNCRRYGITVGGSGSLIKGNYLYKPQIGMTASGSNHIYEGNEIEGLYDYGTLGDCDYSRFFGSGHVFRNNYFHGMVREEVGDAHVDCWQTFDVNGNSANSILVYNNTCMHCSQGFMGEASQHHNSADLTFDHNTIAHCGAWGIDSINIARVTVTHNTFYDIYWYGVGLREDYATGSVIKNNIFVGDMTAHSYMISEGATGVGDYNLIFNAADPQDIGPNDIIGQDPLFAGSENDDFHLLDGSPACTGGEGGTYIGRFPCSGYVPPEKCTDADQNSDGSVSNTEMLGYIGGWKTGAVSIESLMSAVEGWKGGC